MLKRLEGRHAAEIVLLKFILLAGLAGTVHPVLLAQSIAREVRQTQPLPVAQQAQSFQARRSPKEIEALIRTSARKYGLPEEKVVYIAWRESKFQPGARSKSGRYVGLYQFDLMTWRNTPEGRAGLRREDPVANINAAHWHMKEYGFQAWAVGGAHATHRRSRVPRQNP